MNAGKKSRATTNGWLSQTDIARTQEMHGSFTVSLLCRFINVAPDGAIFGMAMSAAGWTLEILGKD
jgi:hypothetical protein